MDEKKTGSVATDTKLQVATLSSTGQTGSPPIVLPMKVETEVTVKMELAVAYISK